MPVLLDDLLEIVQTHLNDHGGEFWKDSKQQLIVYVHEAIRDLQLELNIHGVPLVAKQSNPITVLAGASDLGVNQPNDIIEPLVLQEKQHGVAEDYDEMVGPRTFLPLVSQPEAELVWWAWVGGLIKFVSVGASTDRDVVIQYRAGIALPQADDDEWTLGFPNGEMFCAPRAAMYACNSLGDTEGAAKFEGLALTRLQKVIQSNVRTMQRLPIRRRPYRRSRRTQPFR